MARIPRPPASLLVDVLEEHLDDLDHLLRQRRTALRSPLYTLNQLNDIDRRIDAHADGLTIGGRRTEALAVERLAADDRGLLVAAAFALLRLDEPSGPIAVLDALRAAESPRAEALGEALCLGSIAAVEVGLEEALRSGAPDVAVAAAEALAHAGHLDAQAPRLPMLLADGSPEVRASGWRAIALADPRAPPNTARAYEEALADSETRVREAALTAAAWTRQPRLVEHCRTIAAVAAPHQRAALGLLAVLGEPGDIDRLLAAARTAALGPDRFEWLASFGHVGVGEALLAGMALPDPKAAAAAMAAFTRMTGIDVSSGKHVPVQPDIEGTAVATAIDPDLLDDVPVPDLEKASRFWAAAGARFHAGARWAGGHDVGGPAGLEIAGTLDLRTRWEAHLRARHAGHWTGNAADLERLTIS
jgi:uncharacterized protein (TIGR02270 family)